MLHLKNMKKYETTVYIRGSVDVEMLKAMGYDPKPTMDQRHHYFNFATDKDGEVILDEICAIKPFMRVMVYQRTAKSLRVPYNRNMAAYVYSNKPTNTFPCHKMKFVPNEQFLSEILLFKGIVEGNAVLETAFYNLLEGVRGEGLDSSYLDENEADKFWTFITPSHKY